MSVFLHRVFTSARSVLQWRELHTAPARSSARTLTHPFISSYKKRIDGLFHKENFFPKPRILPLFGANPRFLAISSKRAPAVVLQEVINEQKFDETEINELLEAGKWEFSVEKEHLLLKRDWNEKEKIYVWIQTEVKGDEKSEAEDVEDSSNPMASQKDIFTIQISDKNKEGHMLEFFCEAVAGRVEIDEVVVNESPDVKRQMYFNELDEKVQNLLVAYLTERGLYDETLPRLIFLLLNRYDHEYYVDFLKSLQAFIKS
jgi:hypothetical protein